MTAERLLADTNVLIHQLSGDQRVGDLLKDRKVHISFVTQIELLSWPGYTAKERAVVAKQIQEFIIMDASERVKMIAIDLRVKTQVEVGRCLDRSHCHQSEHPAGHTRQTLQPAEGGGGTVHALRVEGLLTFAIPWPRRKAALRKQ